MNKMMGNKKVIALFTLPTLALFTLIVFYPILQTVYRSFFDWNGLTTPIFTGLENYKKLFTDDLFYESMKNGLIFAAILVVFQVGLATIFTMILMNPRVRGKRFFRSAYFIPAVLSVTVVCQLWGALYNPEGGLFNKIFELLGMSYRQNWLSDMKFAIVAVAFVNVWQYAGYQLCIIYSSAKSIPEEYMEAAKIDGANQLQLNRYILIPLLKDTYKMSFIFAITGGLNAFAHMNILTKGGPGTSTYTLTYMTFRNAFTVGKYGYGCTSAVLLVVQCLVATILINWLFRNKDGQVFEGGTK